MAVEDIPVFSVLGLFGLLRFRLFFCLVLRVFVNLVIRLFRARFLFRFGFRFHGFLAPLRHRLVFFLRFLLIVDAQRSHRLGYSFDSYIWRGRGT